MIDQPATYSAPFIVQADHPALPGHFPGNPVVPGVLILEQVVRMVEASTHSPVRLRGLTYAKFLAPLFPGELARIVVEAAGERLSFGVYRDGVLIAKGAYAVRDCDPS